MGTLSTAAWVTHDLAMAASIGGNLFGKVGLEPAVSEISSASERGRVLDHAWGSYSWLSGGSLLLAAGTWLAGRTMLSGFEVGPHARRLTLVKDVLMAGFFVTGVGSIVVGRSIGAGKGGSVPLDRNATPYEPAERTKKTAVAALSTANLLFGIGVAGITAVLAMKSGRSTTWSVFSRFLP